MTASPTQAAPPRQRLWLAALTVTCCLGVYVVLVPILVHGSAVSWELSTASIVAGAATVAVLALLWRLKLEDAAMRRALRRLTAQSQENQAQIERQAAEASERTADLGRQAAEIGELSAKVTDLYDSEQRLRGEYTQLQLSNRTLLGQSEAFHRAVRHTFEERVPAALAGTPVPALEDDIDAELAKLLDEAVSGSAAIGDQQDSMRSAVISLARRVQASAHRIQEESTLMADRHPGDADVLEVSMRVDHAAAQQARHAQSMAVLCGEWPGQQWPEALPLVDVVRAAAGRIIAYRRIEVAGDQDIAASAPIVEPMIHLVAELLANATQSSPPATKVPVTVRTVQRGAVIEVHDCGVGLDDYRLTHAREIASGGRVIGLDDLGEFPQTGLAVVGQYVRRHGLRVDISESVYGGVRTVVGVPASLVETVAPADAVPAPATATATATAAATAAATATATAAPANAAPAPADAVPAPSDTAPAVPETRVPWAGEAESGAEADIAADAAKASPKAADGPRRGLPRRHSPRHGTSLQPDDLPLEDKASPERADASAEPAAAGPAPEEPTPEEAGAWMGAFLNSNDNSGQEQ
ncbi:MAG: ATP-binding protein [Trebonia sp.]